MGGKGRLRGGGALPGVRAGGQRLGLLGGVWRGSFAVGLVGTHPSYVAIRNSCAWGGVGWQGRRQGQGQRVCGVLLLQSLQLLLPRGSQSWTQRRQRCAAVPCPATPAPHRSTLPASAATPCCPHPSALPARPPQTYARIGTSRTHPRP